MEKSIIIAGYGGQGVLFAGKLLSYAAIIENMNTTWIPSYGAEMRGGSANCSVKIANDEIGSPIINKPDILIALNIPSFNRFEKDVKKDGLIIVCASENEVTKSRDDINYFFITLKNLTKNIQLSFINIVALSAMVRKTKLLKIESLILALNKLIPKNKLHMLTSNIEAIKLSAKFVFDNKNSKVFV